MAANVVSTGSAPAAAWRSTLVVNQAIHVSWRSLSHAATSSLFDGYMA